MASTASLNQSYTIFTSSAYKTPKLKEIIPASSSYIRARDEVPHPSIVMDEYGQTPDHYYLAKKSPAFFQVKRKLDLQIVESTKSESPSSTERRSRKNGHSTKPSKTDKPRYDTSLGQLTKKFLKLLTEATDGVINLNSACMLLAVPKRRLYDITNVLEGAGLIQKKSRNNIQWKGRISSSGANVKKCDIEKEIDVLEAKENKLDELIYHMKQGIDAYKEKTKKYQFVTADDFKDLEQFFEKQLIGISISPGHFIETTEKSISVTNQRTEIQASLLCDISSLNLDDSTSELTLENFCMSIENNSINACSDVLKSPKSSSEKVQSPVKLVENECASPDIIKGGVWDDCLEDDTGMRNAFINSEDDIAPLGRHYLLETEDQNIDDLLPFPYLESSIDAYSFSLDDGEGLTDLYDCGFQGIVD